MSAQPVGVGAGAGVRPSARAANPVKAERLKQKARHPFVPRRSDSFSEHAGFIEVGRSYLEFVFGFVLSTQKANKLDGTAWKIRDSHPDRLLSVGNRVNTQSFSWRNVAHLYVSSANYFFHDWDKVHFQRRKSKD
jgi:hypothetical protein